MDCEAAQRDYRRSNGMSKVYVTRHADQAFRPGLQNIRAARSSDPADFAGRAVIAAVFDGLNHIPTSDVWRISVETISG